MFLPGRVTTRLLTIAAMGAAMLIGACTGSTQDHARKEVRSADCIVCHAEDVQHALNPPHEGFPDTCGTCHSNDAWIPAVGGTHPENAFPIQDGPHSKYRNDCVSCHNPELGSSIAGENADCVGCHDGEHTRAEMDPRHDEEPDYPLGAAPPNFCLDCHADGRK